MDTRDTIYLGGQRVNDIKTDEDDEWVEREVIFQALTEMKLEKSVGHNKIEPEMLSHIGEGAKEMFIK